MTDAERQELEDIRRWFANHGFKIEIVREAGDLVWAELGRLPSGRLVAPKYGSGSSELAAARRAKERFEQEQ